MVALNKSLFWPWPYQTKLVQIHKRRNRFVAEGLCLSSGKKENWHVPNTGSLLSVWHDNATGLVLPTQKDGNTQGRLVAIQVENTWVGIDTSVPNRLFAVWANVIFAQHGIEILEIQPEFRQKPQIRWDARIKYIKGKVFETLVEIKNVTLKVQNQGQFPDAITARGQKHLKGLMEGLSQGWEAWLLFVVQRNDVQDFGPAAQIDPTYAKLLKQAHQMGVKIWIWQCHIDPTGITWIGELPLNLTHS